MKSIFTQKTIKPENPALKAALGDTFELWKTLAEFAKKANPDASEAWKFSGEKFGWSFRIQDKKRVLIYLLPRDSFFKAAFVFGQKAYDAILNSTVSESIVQELKSAKAYTEGRGIRIEVKDTSVIPDIMQLITIKTEN